MADRSVVVRLRAEVGNFRRGMNEAADAMDQTQKKWEGVEKAGQSLALVGGAIVAGVGLAVKAYADFDAQMSKVQAATHATSGEMDQLRDAAVRAGADTAFSAVEAGQAIEELSKAGVSTADILGGGLDGALALAAAGELRVADAAEIAATAMTQFKLSGDKIPHLADLLAAGAGKAQGSVEDLGMALKQSGLVAAQYGLSVEETVGGLAAFASAGLLGSDAGTSLKTMLQRLTPQSEEAAGKMRELGFSAFDAQGNMKSLPEIAGNLQQSMKDLTPEARNAAMAVIFGSDAVRAASVLYEQGAQGIDKWISAVDDAGYAALTAAMNQDNLKGDLEKLSGSIDSVFLKSGKGANDVLRGLVQGAEDLVDAIGKIPAPMLQTGVGLAGLAGATALVAGGIMMAIPRIMAARAAWTEFAGANTRLAGGLGKVAKAAGVAVAAIAALQIIGAVSKAMAGTEKTATDYANAFLTIGQSSKDLDAVVKNTSDLGTQINGVGDALVRVGSFDWYDNMNNFLGDMVGGTSRTQQFRDSVKQVDQTMSALVAGGSMTKAAQAFNTMTAEADKSAKAQGRSGMSAADVLKLMPSYRSALLEQATALGATASESELLEMAQGRLPEKITAVAKANGKAAEVQALQKGLAEEQAKALAEVGLAADGTIIALDRFISKLFAAGLANMSAEQASDNYIQKLEDLDAAIQKNGKTLDANTVQGRANRQAIRDIAEAGITMMDAMAKNGASQEELQGKLRGTYDSLIAAYEKFGITGEAADELARKALGVPKNVNIDTWMSDQAKKMAEQITGDLDKLDGRRITIYTDHYITSIEQRAMLPDLNGPEVSGSGRPGLASGGVVPRLYSAGGAVDYLASGGRPFTMYANGTDTVPAMLTPGEQVIKRSSARSLGYEGLAYANATGRWPGGTTGGNGGTTVNFGDIVEAVSPAATAIEVTRRLEMKFA